MIRTTILAVSALVLFSAASATAGEIHVKASGKAPAELRAEIVKAAKQVCWDELRSEALASYAYGACVRDAVDRAAAQISAPQEVAANPAVRAQ
jgi:hypothetical protein